MSYSVLLTLILLGATRISAQVADNCSLYYIEQPITSVDCDIYDPRLEKIVLTCTISSEGSSDTNNSNDIIIKWYYNNGTEHELTVGTNNTRREGGNGVAVVLSSTLAIGTIPEAASLAPGSYYCRSQVLGRDGLSNSSQPFTVLMNRDIYFQYATSCTERNFIARDRVCAVYNNVAENATTTTDNFNDLMTSLPQSEINQSTSGPPQIFQDQKRIQIYYIVAPILAAVFAIIITNMAIILAIFCLRKSKLKKMAGNIDGIYETIDDVINLDEPTCSTCDAHEVENEGVLMEGNSAFGTHLNHTNEIEMQSCDAYKVEKEGILMEHNSAYGTCLNQANEIEMQICDAYEVEKESVLMEHNAAYGTRLSQTNDII